ncbi:MAG: NERD domain-containing protein [Gammaproteobacteria bacterium]|nr:NERD domain-containing protein [Gammaproteobacteria bacterium]NNF48523.1 NERD domain-containing protein [Woeseiaceae bacterium]MBT8093637.1 NERD domain-containing protein [Gammaproteobacteria bacterium]MBT8106301.1 NERD domain-containing protein [Gammaproteobacteria bacterium]NNK26315.1 NERD domain-containing protein [Woeseiaceae bacterium]
MTSFEETPWLLPLLGVFALLLVWFMWRRFFARGNLLERALADISYERIENFVIPGADEGEILVDQLLLTSQGLLILETKDVRGAVFGGDKMSDWTVIGQDRRYTFRNPQPALYDRIAAVRQIVRQVPVDGRVLFLDGAEFTKGVPSLVCNLEELVREFGEPDKDAARFKIEAFKPHWELIVNRAG